tara:strand:+ start:815 stop:1528 length:714 start_codon:yes stop_codon:yes gene_type:complete
MTKKIVLIMMAAASFATAGSASADNVVKGLSFGAVGTYSTQDIWRGQKQGDDDFRLGVTAELGLFGVPTNAKLAWSENDLQNEFEFSLGTARDFTLPVVGDVVGHVTFNYYSEGTDIVGDVESEFGVGFGKDLGLANVSLTQFIALEGDNSGYGEIGANFGEVFEGISLTGTLGYVLEDFKATHVELTANLPNLPFEILDTAFTPFLKGVYTFDGREGIWANDGAEFIGGISLSKSF